MNISARNVLRGTVRDLRKDSVAAQIQVDIGGGNVVTSTITADSAERLALEPGKAVSVIIKASDVMIGTDD
jgi:molybdopterin-binding protein